MNVSHTTCLSCNTQSTMPLPPTSMSDEPIDGRKRAKRRHQLATTRKIPFHQRESIPAQGDDNATKGHTLYRKQEVIHNWGELPEGPVEETDTSTEA
jgi:hypothetical protein